MRANPMNRPGGDRRRGASWKAVLPLGVAILALCMVIATLILVGRETRGERREIIQVTEPARAHLYDLQRLLALEEGERRGGPPVRPAESRMGLGELRREEEQVFARLRPLVHELGPEAAAALAELRTFIARWHSPGQEEAQDVYAEALAAADRLHAILDDAAAERRDRILSLERLEIALIAGMVVLALAALLVLLRVGRRQLSLTEEARRLAGESEARRREIERIAEEKSQFIRGITHDLKNPLGAIDAYAQLLEAGIKGDLTADQRHYVERIRRATHEILGTINDLLELARAEASQVPVERRAIDIARVVEEVAEDYRASLEAGGLALSLDIADDLPPIETDERRVREIIGNLLSNALKYTPAGGSVRVSTEADAAGAAAPRGEGEWVAVRVADTGPGIPPEEQERIFQEFHRVGGQTAAGTGLGLAISRRLARLIGGEITVESEVGVGSTFTLRLPLAASPSPQRSP